MKKFRSAVCLFFILFFCLGSLIPSVSAQGNFAVSVKKVEENTFDLTFFLKEPIKTATLGIDYLPLVEKGFQITQGKWLLKEGMLSGVDSKGGTAVFSYEEEKEVTGEIFRFRLTFSQTPAFGTVNLDLIYENGQKKSTFALNEDLFVSEEQPEHPPVSSSSQTSTTVKKPQGDREPTAPKTQEMNPLETETEEKITLETQENPITHGGFSPTVTEKVTPPAEKNPLAAVFFTLIFTSALVAVLWYFKKK